MQKPYPEFRETTLWRAVASAIADLESSKEIRVATAPDYVIGYICQELAAKSVVSSDALARKS